MSSLPLHDGLGSLVQCMSFCWSSEINDPYGIIIRNGNKTVSW